MLTSLSRVASRRVLSATASSSAGPQLLRSVASAGRPTALAAARTFTVSARTRLPAASAGAGTTKKAASTKPRTKTKSAGSKTSVKPKKPAAAKKTPAAKKKPVVKKPAVPKKEVDPETKTKLEIRESKKKALLQTPDKLPETAWVVYLSRQLKGTTVGGLDLANSMKEHGSTFKSLPAYEINDLQATGDANKKANEAAYKAWVESHPVERIAIANLARRRLTRLTEKRVSPIRDDRLPRRPGSAFTIFVKARYTAPGASEAAPARLKELGAEWKALSDADRRSFEDLAAEDSAKYKVEADALRERVKELQAQDALEEKQASDVKKQAAREKRAANAAAARASKAE